MRKLLLLLITFIICTPAFGQLGCPLTPKLDTGPIKFFRVALMTPTVFDSQECAQGVADIMSQKSEVENYIFKVVTEGKQYRIIMMIKIIFFDRKEAENAILFLEQNPKYKASPFQLQVVEDELR